MRRQYLIETDQPVSWEAEQIIRQAIERWDRLGGALVVQPGFRVRELSEAMFRPSPLGEALTVVGGGL